MDIVCGVKPSMRIMQSVIEINKSVPENCILKRELSSSPITKIYSCIFNDVKAVIRFDLPAAHELRVDRQNEINILKAINHLGLSPEVLYYDIDTGILIWKFISGVEPSPAENKSNLHSLRDLGASLSSLHSLPIPENTVDIFSNSMIVYRSLPDNSSEKILFDKALALFNKLEQDGAKRVLSHNDLHQKNILWNKKYYFIDWEYSGLNHPCFDIASLVRSFKLNQSQINELSIGYKVNNKFFRLDVLNPWIEFIDNLEKIWSISLSKILRNLEHKDI